MSQNKLENTFLDLGDESVSRTYTKDTFKVTLKKKIDPALLAARANFDKDPTIKNGRILLTYKKGISTRQELHDAGFPETLDANQLKLFMDQEMGAVSFTNFGKQVQFGSMNIVAEGSDLKLSMNNQPTPLTLKKKREIIGVAQMSGLVIIYSDGKGGQEYEMMNYNELCSHYNLVAKQKATKLDRDLKLAKENLQLQIDAIPNDKVTADGHYKVKEVFQSIYDYIESSYTSGCSRESAKTDALTAYNSLNDMLRDPTKAQAVFNTPSRFKNLAIGIAVLLGAGLILGLTIAAMAAAGPAMAAVAIILGVELGLPAGLALAGFGGYITYHGVRDNKFNNNISRARAYATDPDTNHSPNKLLALKMKLPFYSDATTKPRVADKIAEVEMENLSSRSTVVVV